ncbi:YncE family protein [Cryobacterium ruanii]|uniref:YncE family protein n=2 Tax=Cryobacterium ruanii TaxID=1259197 RepID=A0A4R9ATK5_9MICO|nr:YncE family protein [Cryobacterium ruanii]
MRGGWKNAFRSNSLLKATLMNKAFARIAAGAVMTLGASVFMARAEEATTPVSAGVAVGTLPCDVAFSPDGRRVYVVNAVTQNVSVIDVASGLVVGTIALKESPRKIAVSADGAQAWVTLSTRNSVAVIDLATGTLLAPIAVGHFPTSVAFGPGVAYVTNSGAHSVSIVDIASRQAVASIAVGDEPRALAFSPNGTRACVANFRVGTVSIIDVEAGAICHTITVPGGFPSAIAFAGGTAFVAHGGGRVSVIDVGAGAVECEITVGSGPCGLAVSPDERTLLVTNQNDDTVSVVDVATRTVRDTVAVGLRPVAVAISPDGTAAYVADCGDSTVSVIDLEWLAI